MKYISTRGDTDPKPFSEVLLMGLAPDGGLMLPEHYPQVSVQTLESWRGLSYPDLAFEVMRLFITDIPAADLRDIINRVWHKSHHAGAHALRRHQNRSALQRPYAGV